MTDTKCTTCNGHTNIRINKLDYCNTCFERHFLHKILKHFRKLPFGSRVLIYLNGSSFSLVAAHAISRLKNRSLHEFIIHCERCAVHDEFFRSLGFDEHSLKEVSFGRADGLVPLPSEIIDAFAAGRFDVLIFQAHCELEAVIALSSVCKGLGMSGSLGSHALKPSKTKVLNVFHGVKSKEIRYYQHLNKGTIPMGTSLHKKGGLEGVLYRFVEKIDNKNSLMLFNVLNTVEKIVSDLENRDVSD